MSLIARITGRRRGRSAAERNAGIAEQLSFERVGPLALGWNDDGSIYTDDPAPRYKDAGRARLNPHGQGPFCRFRLPTDEQRAGVYLFEVGGDVRYVGIAANLAQRFNSGYGNISPRNCYVGGQSTNCRINKLVLSESVAGRTVSIWFRPEADRRELERQLIERLAPVWNVRS